MNEATVRALIRKFAAGLLDGDYGDISIAAGTWTIDAGAVDTGKLADGAVTNGKLADMAAARIKGRATAGTGDPEDLTGTQVTALLDTFTSTDRGLVPASGGGTTNFLRADGTWATSAPTTTDVLNAIAGASVGAVGTYAMLTQNTPSSSAANTTFAGSGLTYSNASGAGAGTPSGTWRLMGRTTNASVASGTSLFLRIS